MGCLDTVADRTPVDAFELTDGCLAHLADQPCHLIIKCRSEPAGPISPRNPFIEGSMFRTKDTLWLVEDVHGNSIEIGRPPAAFIFHLVPVPHTLLLANRAEALASLERACVNYDALLFIGFSICLICADSFLAVFYMHELEIENVF